MAEPRERPKPGFYHRLSRAQRAEYDRSDARREIPIAPEPELGAATDAVVAALATEDPKRVTPAAQGLTDALIANLNRRLRRTEVSSPRIRVLRRRPRSAASELHGLYTREEGERAEIRVWMITAANRNVVKPRTFLRVLLHEICHHLDLEVFDLPSTFHSGGFHARESSLVRGLERCGATIPGGRKGTRPEPGPPDEPRPSKPRPSKPQPSKPQPRTRKRDPSPEPRPPKAPRPRAEVIEPPAPSARPAPAKPDVPRQLSLFDDEG